MGALLLKLQRLAFAHQALILATRLLISGEGLDFFAGSAQVRLIENRLAKFFSFLRNHAFLSRHLHSEPDTGHSCLGGSVP